MTRFAGETAGVAIAIGAVTSAIACGVQVAFAGAAQRLLGFPFAGLEPTPQTATAILLSNLRLLVGVVAAAVIVQSPWFATRRGRRSSAGLVVLSAFDALIVLEVALNTLVVGASLGAYGSRMAAAMLPHGPFELAAFAAALALYRRARREVVPARLILGVAAGSVASLLLAAALETYVAL